MKFQEHDIVQIIPAKTTTVGTIISIYENGHCLLEVQTNKKGTKPYFILVAHQDIKKL